MTNSCSCRHLLLSQDEAAAGDVWRVAAFGDDSLQAEFAHFFAELWAGPFHVVAESYVGSAG